MSAGSPAIAEPAARPPEPTAEDKETARNAYHLGVERFHAEDYHGALEAFEAADRIMGVPTTGLELGRTRAMLGLLVEARDRLLQVTRYPEEPGEPQPFWQARIEAKRLAEEIAQRIPSARIEVTRPGGPLPEGTEVAIRIDGKPLRPDLFKVPRRLNPGPHTVEVRAAGFEPQKQTIALKEKEQRVIQFVLTQSRGGASTTGGPGGNGSSSSSDGSGTLDSGPDSDTTEPAGISPLAVVGFSVGGAGLLVGSITGIVTLADTSSLEDACPNKRCTPEQQADLDQAKTLGHVSTASFIVGGVGAAVGVLGLVLSDWNGADAQSPTQTASAGAKIRPLLSPTSVGLAGTF